MSALQTSEEKYYNYGTNSYCDYVILPNSVEVPMLETDNIQQLLFQFIQNPGQALGKH